MAGPELLALIDATGNGNPSRVFTVSGRERTLQGCCSVRQSLQSRRLFECSFLMIARVTADPYERLAPFVRRGKDPEVRKPSGRDPV